MGTQSSAPVSEIPATRCPHCECESLGISNVAWAGEEVEISCHNCGEFYTVDTTGFPWDKAAITLLMDHLVSYAMQRMIQTAETYGLSHDMKRNGRDW